MSQMTQRQLISGLERAQETFHCYNELSSSQQGEVCRAFLNMSQASPWNREVKEMSWCYDELTSSQRVMVCEAFVMSQNAGQEVPQDSG